MKCSCARMELNHVVATKLNLFTLYILYKLYKETLDLFVTHASGSLSIVNTLSIVFQFRLLTIDTR